MWERLQKRLRELELLQRGAAAEAIAAATPALDTEDLEDLEDAPDNEVEEAEEEILDQRRRRALSANSKPKSPPLGDLNRSRTPCVAAARIVSGANPRACSEKSSRLPQFPPTRAMLPLMEPIQYRRQNLRRVRSSLSLPKRRDTPSYLGTRVTTLLRRKEAVVVIPGSMGR